MVYGDSSLILKHLYRGATIHFDVFDALSGWKQEGLPPVEVPSAAQWTFRSLRKELYPRQGDFSLFWEDCEEKIGLAALATREPILFYDEVVLYEDELADNVVSLLTVKMRVMPSCWFLLQQFWLRVDGVLIRLRDTRMYCRFEDTNTPSILKEICWRKAKFKALSAQEHPTDSASYSDPSIISQRLPVIMHKTQKLVMPGNL